MSTNKDDRSHRGWLLAIPALLLLYPLSLGPVMWLSLNKSLADPALKVLDLAYRPLIRFCEKEEWAGQIMNQYLDLWILTS